MTATLMKFMYESYPTAIIAFLSNLRAPENSNFKKMKSQMPAMGGSNRGRWAMFRSRIHLLSDYSDPLTQTSVGIFVSETSLTITEIASNFPL